MAAPFRIPNQEQYMPRPAPVDPEDAPEATGPVDLYSRLAEYIDSILDEDEPSAPTPESVRLSPWQAAGAALNPQSANQIIGLASQPVEARNLAAQREFERQMDTRDRALGVAGSMVNAGLRRQNTRFGAESGFRPETQLYRDEAGNVFVSTLTVGTEGIGEPVLTPGFPGGPEKPVGQLVLINPAPRTIETQGGIKEYDPRRGTITKDPLAQPKPGAQDVADTSNIGNLLGRIRSISQSAVIRPGDTAEFVGRVGQEVGRRLPIIGPRVSGRADPEGEAFARDTEYIRSQMQLILTGKQVNETEIRRLLAMIPDLADATNPEFYLSQMQKFEDQFANVLRRQAQLRPDLFTAQELKDLGGGAPTPTPAAPRQNFSGKGMPRSKFDKYPPDVQEEIKASGVKIIEGQ